MKHSLVRRNDLPNGHVIGSAQVKQVLTRLELIRNGVLSSRRGDTCWNAGVGLKLGIKLLAGQDEPATDGEILRVLGEDGAVFVPSSKNKAVRVLGHRLVVEFDAVFHLACRAADAALGRDEGIGAWLSIERNGERIPTGEA